MSKPVNRLAAEEAWREARKDFDTGIPWLEEARQTAFAAFEGEGLPTPRTEDWRWSDIHRYLNAPYPPALSAPTEDLDALLARNPFAGVDASLMVFVNGRLDTEHSHVMEEDGVDVLALSDAPLAPEWADFSTRDDAIDRLNLAYVTDGVLIRVRAGLAASIPLVILNITTGDGISCALRHQVRVEEGASFTFYEVQLGSGDHVANVVTSVKLDEGASLARIQANLKDETAIHFANFDADIGRAARLHDLAVLVGGRFHRQQDFIDFTGEEAEARVDSAYLLRGRQHADTRLVVNHAVPHCTSRETFKCVMDDNARGAFQGRIHVAPGAQKTDGQMAAHGLLLGEMAEFDAKPELEIYADDVVCAHGATAGALDEEQLFYLRARGITERRARGMLISAFVAETFDDVEDEAARSALQELAETWLSGEGNS